MMMEEVGDVVEVDVGVARVKGQSRSRSFESFDVSALRSQVVVAQAPSEVIGAELPPVFGTGIFDHSTCYLQYIQYIPLHVGQLHVILVHARYICSLLFCH